MVRKRNQHPSFKHVSVVANYYIPVNVGVSENRVRLNPMDYHHPPLQHVAIWRPPNIILLVIWPIASTYLSPLPTVSQIPYFPLFSVFVFALSKAATKFRNIMAVSASSALKRAQKINITNIANITDISAAEHKEKRSADKHLKLRCLDPKFPSRNWKGWTKIPHIDGRILQMTNCAMSKNAAKYWCLVVGTFLQTVFAFIKRVHLCVPIPRIKTRRGRMGFWYGTHIHQTVCVCVCSPFGFSL